MVIVSLVVSTGEWSIAWKDFSPKWPVMYGVGLKSLAMQSDAANCVYCIMYGWKRLGIDGLCCAVR